MPIYQSGTTINNRYEVVQGPNEKPSLAGGMGLVYLCVDRAEDGKPVALKTFRPELLSNRAARDRFLREGTTWVELGKHPHIVHCYQVFKADVGSEVFFALELVAAAEGKKDASLRSWLIPNEPLPLEKALLFALHICRGMLHATNKIPGMVHRDLKPENILIGRDGRARVTDFGLASAAQNLDSNWQMDGDKTSSHIRTQLTHGIAGTPLYMAPEQWKGETLDERADIYAFGCILYEMLCGRFAVNGKNVKELKEAHCQGRLRDITVELNESLSSLLHRCLALNNEDRFLSWDKLEKHIADVYYLILDAKAPELKKEITGTSHAHQIAVGWSYIAMGVSYHDIGKYKVACDYFSNALATSRKIYDRVLEGTALGNIGEAYRQLGDPHLSIDYSEKSLSISREIGDRNGEAQALGNLAIAYFQMGSHLRAIKYFEQCLSIFREIGNRYGEGQALGNLGNAYDQLGQPQRAIEFYKQRLSITRDISDRFGEGQTLGNLGLTYANIGNLRQAIDFHEQRLAIAREIGDRQGEGQALGNMGSSYNQLGDPLRAIEFHGQSLAIACEIGDRFGEARTLANLGSAYNKLADHRRAIAYFEQGLAIAREIGDIIGTANTSFNIALILQQERPSEALNYAKEALQIFNQIGHKQYTVRVQALIEKICR